jgi:UDP-N-acetylmuramoylalanine--D-glutamate ligase
LEQPTPDLYVLELSSFQLETTSSLELLAAVVLNVTADHMDRYARGGVRARQGANFRSKAATVVLNADDPLGGRHARRYRGATWCAHRDLLGAARDADFSLLRAGAQVLLARRGEALLDIARMKIAGLHNAANALAALALGEAAGCPCPPCSRRWNPFPGSAAPLGLGGGYRGVRYIDDSKGTNVGATIAAVAGMPGSRGADRRRRGQGAGLHAAGRRLSRQGGTAC